MYVKSSTSKIGSHEKVITPVFLLANALTFYGIGIS